MKENFGENISQREKTLDRNRENDSEKLGIKIELATPDDWESCKRMRVELLSSSDASMIVNVKSEIDKKLKKEEVKKEKEWKEELSDKNKFTFLSKNGSEVIGMGRAKQKKKGTWVLYSGYIRKEFQGKGIGKRMFALRLKEIINRGGIKALVGVRINNDKSMNIAKYFDFKTKNILSASMMAKKILLPKWKVLEADLTNPEIIKKIENVLNER
jgi:ribosomal protein S18 acetylase RimI-like enzyme